MSECRLQGKWSHGLALASKKKALSLALMKMYSENDWCLHKWSGLFNTVCCVCVCMLAYIYPCMSLLGIPLILGHRIINVNSQSNLNYPKPTVLQKINTENENWTVTCPMSCNASMTKVWTKAEVSWLPVLYFLSPSYLALCWYDWDTPPKSHHSQLLLFLYKIYLCFL